MNVDRIPQCEVYRHDFSNFNEQAFKDDISTQEWNLDNPQGTHQKFTHFLMRMENCIDHHDPIKKLNRKQNRKISKHWIANYIKLMSQLICSVIVLIVK